MPTNGKEHRISIALSQEDNELLIKLRSSFEQRLKKRISISQIIRIALNNQANLEGLN